MGERESIVTRTTQIATIANLIYSRRSAESMDAIKHSTLILTGCPVYSFMRCVLKCSNTKQEGTEIEPLSFTTLVLALRIESLRVKDLHTPDTWNTRHSPQILSILHKCSATLIITRSQIFDLSILGAERPCKTASYDGATSHQF